MATRLAAAGHDVRILTSRVDRDLPQRQTIRGIDIQYVTTAPAWARGSSGLRFYLSRLPWFAIAPFVVPRAVAEFRPDIVVEDLAPVGIPLLARSLRAAGVPLVYDAHNLRGSLHRWWRIYGPIGAWGWWFERRLSRGHIRPDLLVSDSRPLLGHFAEAAPWLTTVRVPNGVDIVRFEPVAPQPGTLHVMAVGRYAPIKGHRFLVEAAALLKGRVDFDVTIYGDGPLAGSLKALARRLGVEEVVRFAGRVPHAEIHWAFAAAGLFAMPSLAEGMPVALIEALGAGLPIVASDLPELREVAPDGTICFVRPADSAALAGAIEQLAADPALRARMGAAGRHLAVDAYDWDRATDAFVGALTRAAGNGTA